MTKSHKFKDVVSTSKSLEQCFFVATKVFNLGGKIYGFVIVDNYSRFTWVFFMENKNKTLQEFLKFSKEMGVRKS